MACWDLLIVCFGFCMVAGYLRFDFVICVLIDFSLVSFGWCWWVCVSFSA